MSSLKLYFSYGSNLWQAQMAQRCPHSPHKGIARLLHYRWFISSRGSANIGATENPDDEVWGLVYALTPAEEARLDIREHVPEVFEKRMVEVEYWAKTSAVRGVEGEPGRKPETVPMLVYIDFKRVVDGEPRAEYIHRMNSGIQDALREGVPKAYVDGVLRKFIPEHGDEAAKALALKRAQIFEDE